jgi:RNA polymerase sigma factor (sigma-70 family)
VDEDQKAAIEKAVRQAVGMYSRHYAPGTFLREYSTDLYQQSYCECLAAVDRYEPGKGELEVYLRTVATNAARNALRAESSPVTYKHRPGVMDGVGRAEINDDLREAPERQDRQFDEAEFRQRVRRRIEQLCGNRADLAFAIVGRDKHRYEIGTLATEMGVPVETLYRARTWIMSRIQGDGELYKLWKEL